MPEDSFSSDYMAPFWITYVPASREGLFTKNVPSQRKPNESKNFDMAVPWQMDLVPLARATFPPQHFACDTIKLAVEN